LQPEKRGGGAIAIDTGADAGEGPGRNGRLRSLVINGTILKTATAYGCMYGSHRLCLSRSHFASAWFENRSLPWVCLCIWHEISVHEDDRVSFRSRQWTALAKRGRANYAASTLLNWLTKDKSGSASIAVHLLTRWPCDRSLPLTSLTNCRSEHGNDYRVDHESWIRHGWRTARLLKRNARKVCRDSISLKLRINNSRTSARFLSSGNFVFSVCGSLLIITSFYFELIYLFIARYRRVMF